MPTDPNDPFELWWEREGHREWVEREGPMKELARDAFDAGLSTQTDLRDLIDQLETVIPYVTATLARNNGFVPEKMASTFHGDPAEWLAVHGGRASSSNAQLNGLLGTAKFLKAKLGT